LVFAFFHARHHPTVRWSLDEQWLSRARAALSQYWRLKNARKTNAAAPVKSIS
jgi:hypothetical protein